MTEVNWRARPWNGWHRRSNAAEDAELTHVGPGTPCGEYMRRFWHPVAMTEQVRDLPLAIRVLGEDLVLFRDLSGRHGLLHKHCSHRRTSLEYGIVAERGIRCCYHGWLFDIDGRILETPGEPATSRIRETLCHGAYPVRERDGLLFAYLGPPEKTPDFPVLDTMAQPGNEMVPYSIDYPCNWLQVAENPMDPWHSVFLHTRATRAHFNAAWGAFPVVEWHWMEDRVGIYLTNSRRWNEYIWVRTAENMFPAVAQPPDIYQDADRELFFPRVGITKWTVPVDDRSCRITGWRHFNPTLDRGGKGDRAKVGLGKVDFLGQTGTERSHEEGQRMPSDYEAQVGQGPITVHAEETLGSTDKGVAMLRRGLRRAIRAVAAGEDPPRAKPNADGTIPSFAGDVIVRVPKSNVDDEALQREVGRLVGRVVAETLPMPAATRQAEIERRVRAGLAALGAGGATPG
jgi:nitrite reductase/ring-hydroxylating ferredoxin subunit